MPVLIADSLLALPGVIEIKEEPVNRTRPFKHTGRELPINGEGMTPIPTDKRDTCMVGSDTLMCHLFLWISAGFIDGLIHFMGPERGAHHMIAVRVT